MQSNLKVDSWIISSALLSLQGPTKKLKEALQYFDAFRCKKGAKWSSEVQFITKKEREGEFVWGLAFGFVRTNFKLDWCSTRCSPSK